MKLKREILVFFLAVMFITLSCPAGFADMDLGGNYTLGGYISLGGGWMSDQPRWMSRAYLKQYVPFPQGFLAYTDLQVKSKDGLEYYRFFMSHPGLTDQDYLLQAGKLGVYHAELEYDQLQHLYCDVNPFNNNIGILLQRLRFSGWFSPTLTVTLFAENDFLRRTGWQPGSYVTGPNNPYNFLTYLRPINYRQNDLRLGAEYDQGIEQQNDRPLLFQGRISYHLATFENGQANLLANPGTTNTWVSLPPSNMANYVTGEGALTLKDYMTRITGSLTYGWLSSNDFAFDRSHVYQGNTNLSASTVNAHIAGLTRPIAPLALRYSYNAYYYSNDNTGSAQLLRAFRGNEDLLPIETYSYQRHAINLGADYRVNQMLAFTLGYIWRGVYRTEEQGHTSSNSPQVGVRVTPADWVSLMANYAYVTRTGSEFLISDPLVYKSYSGSLTRNNFNFIAEVYPVNTVTASVNFSIYNDNFTDSTYGIQSDRGWSTGVDVGWRPHDRVALSLGFDHQQLQQRELAVASTIIYGPPGAQEALIGGDAGPTLTTSDSYNTFVARADIKLIPKKLFLTSRGSYSWSYSNYNNSVMNNLNEYYADLRTYLTYQFDEHWACRAGYIFQYFHMKNAYGNLYLQGITTSGAGARANQRFNTLDGYYRPASAHILQAFLQYKF